jgi:hypothetical protein
MSLIVKRHHRLDPGTLLIAGDEVTGLDQATVLRLLDADILVECPTRLSYFALLHDFAGVGQIDKDSISTLFPELAIPAGKSDTVSPS